MGEQRKEGSGGRVIYQAEERRNRKSGSLSHEHSDKHAALETYACLDIEREEKKKQYDGIIASFLSAASHCINYSMWPFIFISMKPIRMPILKHYMHKRV